MSPMEIIAAGQHGLLIQAVAGVIGVEEGVARNAIERLLKAIGRRLSERAADPAEQENVLDVLAGGDFQLCLDDPRALFGPFAVRDGEGLLAYLYGSLEAARAEARRIGPPRGLDKEVFARLLTLAASLLLAALARRLEKEKGELPAEAGLTDYLQDLGRTILRGFADGTVRTLFRRVGFRGRMAMSRMKLRLSRRPGHGPSIDNLLGSLLDKERQVRP